MKPIYAVTLSLIAACAPATADVVHVSPGIDRVDAIGDGVARYRSSQGGDTFHDVDRQTVFVRPSGGTSTVNAGTMYDQHRTVLLNRGAAVDAAVRTVQPEIDRLDARIDGISEYADLFADDVRGFEGQLQSLSEAGAGIFAVAGIDVAPNQFGVGCAYLNDLTACAVKGSALVADNLAVQFSGFVSGETYGVSGAFVMGWR